MPDFAPLLPVIVLVVGMLAVLLLDLKGRARNPWLAIGAALVAFGGAAVLAATQGASSEHLVLGALRVDSFGLALTTLCCVVGFITVLATMRGEAFPMPGGEFLALLLAAVAGMSLLSMSVDLVTLYLAFETVSMPSYVLVGMRRGDGRANEASMKYVLFGAVSSAAMIYGLSFWVGLAGSTSLEALGVAIQNGAGSEPIFWVATLLVTAGFAFKISAVPFHFWAPDVYAGAPASVGGFLAVASKAAGFAALVRVVAAIVPGEVASVDAGTFLPEGPFLLQVVAVLAVLSMTVGNVGALRQREIKRLLAWSSIAHAGYILLAIAVWSEKTLAGLALYLVAYLFMNLAAFSLAGMIIRRQGTGELSAFRHLARRNLGLAIAMAIVLFSLTGLPPFLGFIGKLQLFYGVFEKGFVVLGTIGLVNGVVSLYYYMRVMASMFPFEAQDETQTVAPWRLSPLDRALTVGLVAPVVVFGLFWSPLWTWAEDVVRHVVRAGG